jgi:hypothetical protein
MTAFHVSSIELCPIHFEKFDALNRQIGSIEETLMLSKIMFHLQGSKITRHGVKYIVRSREHIAQWFGFSLRKTDALLSKLESKGFLVRTNGLWHGVKRLFLSVQNVDGLVPVNMALLDVLIGATGSIDAAIAYARIAFIYARAKVFNEGLSWVFLRKNTLASYLSISIRKLDTVLDILIRKGLLLKKNMIACGRRQTHFHIPISSLKVLKERVNSKINSRSASGTLKSKEGVTLPSDNRRSNDSKVYLTGSTEKNPSCNNCRLEPAKFATSIKVRTITKKTNNNTRKGCDNRVNQSIDTNPTGDINFSKRELAYLQGALANLSARDGVRISNPKELLAQMKYALKQQVSKFNLSFVHGVNKLCAIIRSGNWSTPYGFYHHSKEGRVLNQERSKKEKQWQQQKHYEILGTDIADSDIKNQTANYGAESDIGQRIKNIETSIGKQPICRLQQGRVMIGGKNVLISDAKARLNEIHVTIERYVAKIKLLPVHLRSNLFDVIDKLRGEEQEILSVI